MVKFKYGEIYLLKYISKNKNERLWLGVNLK
jgi:hypothetical protein